MKKYTSTRDRLQNVFESQVLPILKNGKELDYYELINGLSMDMGIAENIIEDFIVQLKKSGKLKEIRALAMSDEDIIPYLKKLKEQEQETLKMDEEMQKIESLAAQNTQEIKQIEKEGG